MTGIPPIMPYGPGTDFYNRQQQDFNRIRDEFYQQYFGQVGAPPGVQQAGQQLAYQPLSQPQTWKDEDLVAAARYWGVPEEAARQMTREQLEGIVNQYRSQARPTEENVMVGLGSMVGMFGTEAVQAVTGALRNVPLVGQYLDKIKPLHEADMYLRELQEGLRASNAANEGEYGWQTVLSGGQVAGHLAGLWFPANGAWAASAKIGAAVPLVRGVLAASPIARAAFQGGASGWMLDQVEDQQHPMAAILGGAALGAGFVWAAPRVASFFSRPAGLGGAPGAGGGGGAVPPGGGGPGPYGAGGGPTLDDAQSAVNRWLDAQPKQLEPSLAYQEAMDPMGFWNRSRQKGTKEWAYYNEANTAQVNQWREQAAEGMKAAEAQVAQYNKSAIIIESPLLPKIARQTVIDELAVADAALATNPGGMNTIEGIIEPQKFAQVYGPNVRFANRNGRLSALISDQQVTDDMVAQYEAHGLYEGQRVTTSWGKPATITRVGIRGSTEGAPVAGPGSAPSGSMHEVTELYTGVKVVAPADRVGGPWVASPGVHEVPELWDAFDSFANQKTSQMVSEMGLPNRAERILTKGEGIPAVRADDGRIFKGRNAEHGDLTHRAEMYNDASFTRPDHEVSGWVLDGEFIPVIDLEPELLAGPMSEAERFMKLKNDGLASYMNEFFDTIGVSREADRFRIANYFNERFVDSFRQLAPQEAAFNAAMQADRGATLGSVTATPLGALDDLAQAKGFVARPDGQGGWELQNVAPGLDGTVAETVIPAGGTIEEATALVRGMNRDLPDISPPLSVPGELAGWMPSEPLQMSNINEQQVDLLEKSVVSLFNDVGVAGAGGGGGMAGGPALPPPRMPRIGFGGPPEKDYSHLMNVWKESLIHSAPFRRVTSYIDDVYFRAGRPLGLAADADKMGDLLVAHHNASNPFLNDAADALMHIAPRKKLSGEWMRVFSIQDPVARAAAAKAANWTDKEFAAIGQLEDVLRRLHPNADPLPSIRQALGSVASHQSNPLAKGSGWDALKNDPFLAPWAEMESGRRSITNIRELDPRFFADSYIRSTMWSRNMAEPWGQQKMMWDALAKSDSEDLRPAGAFMSNWLQELKYGYSPENDLATRFVHKWGERVLGKSFTEQHAKELIGLGMNATHQGMLGFSPSKVVRDVGQVMLALPRAGADLAEVILKYGSNPAYRAEVMQSALDAGIVAKQSPRMVAPGSMQAEFEAVQVNPSEYGTRMKIASGVKEAIETLLPDRLRGSADTMLNPLYFYGKQGEVIKAITYEAGRVKAARAIAAFRKGGSVDLPTLMGESAARTFDPSWQRQFQELVASGDDAGAAKFLGGQLAKATQFKYGSAEGPQTMKTMTGKIYGQFGSYWRQYVQFIRESSVNGTYGDRAKAALAAGGVFAAMDAASRETGWNFRLMNPFLPGGFTGGPWIGVAADIAEGGASMIRTATGSPESFQTTHNISDATRALGRAGQLLNPLGGLVRTAKGIEGAMDSPSPGAAMLRHFITGEVGAGPDIQQMLDQMMQPTSDPIRLQGFSLPYIPQRQPTYPADIYGTGTPGSPQDYGNPSNNRPTQYNSGGKDIPPVEVLKALGVTDPSRVYMKNGALVYDSQVQGPDGRYGTHRVYDAPNVLQPGETWEQYEQRAIGGYGNAGPAAKTVVKDLNMLEDDTQARVRALMATASQQGIRLDVGETVRPQQRQEYLFGMGRAPGSGSQPSTWTLSSSHREGRAIDFLVNSDPTGQDAGYRWLWENAPKFGLVPMGAMDPGHLATNDSSVAATPSYPGQRQVSGGGGKGGMF